MLTVDLYEDGNVVSVTIDGLPAMDGEFAPDKKPAFDDTFVTDEPAHRRRPVHPRGLARSGRALRWLQRWYDAARLQHRIGQNGVLNLDLSQLE